MKFLRSFLRSIKFAAQNIVRNIWLSLATITIFVLTLIVVNSVLFLSFLSDEAISNVEERIEVTVYFEPETSLSIAESAQEYLINLEAVESVLLIDRDQNLLAFEERYGDNETVLASLEQIDGNPLGHTLTIKATDPSNFAFIEEALAAPDFSDAIRTIDYTNTAELISRIESLREGVRTWGFVIVLIFTLIAAMIVSNTLRVALYVHRDEIAIMKLVGANDALVKLPFFLEIVLYSLIATALSAAILFAAASQFSDTLLFSELQETLERFTKGYELYLIEFLALICISTLASFSAMRSSLRA
jgi:cell division transport system permease protein